MEAGLAGDWRAALSAPADLVLALLDARAAMAEAAEDDAGRGGGRADANGLVWRDNADGSRSASFASIDALRSLLRSGSQIPGVTMGGGKG